MLTPEPNKDWGANAISAILAIGFASVFLSPLWLSSRPAADQPTAKILGESLSRTLMVTVRIDGLTGEHRYTVPATSGTLAEALTRAAESAGSQLVYVSRGSSIYIDRFMGLKNGGSGWWTVYSSGRKISDLAAVELTPDELIIVSWESL